MIYSEYETIYIIKPEAPEDTIRAINEKIDEIIGRFEGHVLYRDDWGKRKLAYPIRRNSKGHYILLKHIAPSTLVQELERNMRIDDNLLRFLTVRLNEDVDVGAMLATAEVERERRAEVAAAAAAAAAKQAESESAAQAPAAPAPAPRPSAEQTQSPADPPSGD